MLNHVAASTSAGPPGTLFISHFYADGISYTLPYFTPAVSQTFSVNVPTMALPFSFNVSIWQAGMLLNAPHTFLTSGLYSFTFTPGPATSGPVYVEITDLVSPAYPIYSYFSGTAQFTIDTITLDTIVLTPMNVISQIASDDQYHYGFNGQMKDNEWAGVGNHTTAMFWEYDSRTAGRLNLDPRGNVSESPYSTFGRNPIWKWDRLGDTSVQFKPDGTLMGMVDDGKKEISGLLYKTTSNKNGKTTYSGGIQFQFNDWEQDRTAILSGNMQAIEITDEDVDKAMSFSGVQSTEAKSNRWKYIERESRPGENSSLLSGNSKGLMDYVATSPIISPAKLHIIKLSQCSNDTKQYPMSAKGYNDFDFGNFL